MPSQYRVRESVRSVDADTWVIGNQIVISRISTESPGSWSDGNGAYFTVSETQDSAFESTATHPFPLVYDAGDSHAAWKLGEAFLKVIDLVKNDLMDATREHITIQAVRAMNPSFAIPSVLFQGEWDGRYYLVLTEVPGQRLNEAWQSMDENTKDRYVNKIVDICEELAKQNSDQMVGIDGSHIPERYFTKKDGPCNFSPSSLLQACQDIGMDCSRTVFYHADLGPTNIIVDPAKDFIGVIDWEIAGFVPREWIRTKFRLSGGMDLENDETAKDPNTRLEWRRRVQIRLGERGYIDCVSGWWAWFRPGGASQGS